METHTNISEFNPMEDESDNHWISSTDDELEVLEEKMSKLKERKNYYAWEKLKDQVGF